MSSPRHAQALTSTVASKSVQGERPWRTVLRSIVERAKKLGRRADRLLVKIHHKEGPSANLTEQVVDLRLLGRFVKLLADSYKQPEFMYPSQARLAAWRSVNMSKGMTVIRVNDCLVFVDKTFDGQRLVNLTIPLVCEDDPLDPQLNISRKQPVLIDPRFVAS